MKLRRLGMTKGLSASPRPRERNIGLMVITVRPFPERILIANNSTSYKTCVFTKRNLFIPLAYLIAQNCTSKKQRLFQYFHGKPADD